MEQTAEQLELIRDFVAALRSGEYEQGRGRMRLFQSDANGNMTTKLGYCCEGVAFERYGQKLGYTLEYDDDGDMIASYMYGENQMQEFKSWTVAPPRFWQDMGLRDPLIDNHGFVFRDGRGAWEEYASLNDAGLTFNQIADLIEWQFLPPKNGDKGE